MNIKKPYLEDHIGNIVMITSIKEQLIPLLPFETITTFPENGIDMTVFTSSGSWYKMPYFPTLHNFLITLNQRKLSLLEQQFQTEMQELDSKRGR